tara:strand:+ start:218 stop:496 length:279 start_codon:yes stop_codon:yes gene_type:complete
MSMSEMEYRRDNAIEKDFEIDIDDIDVEDEDGVRYFSAKGHATLYKDGNCEISLEVFNETDEDSTFKVDKNSPDFSLVNEYVYDLAESGEIS